MIIHILTLFPDFFTSPLGVSILKRAQDTAAVEFHIVNIRDFAFDKHQVTDDRPYGGGPGMVMKLEPIALALE
jgi:tRNA (guanine37-N1)-methyltransferase